MADDRLLLGIHVGIDETRGALVPSERTVVATPVRPHTVTLSSAGRTEHDVELN